MTTYLLHVIDPPYPMETLPNFDIPARVSHRELIEIEQDRAGLPQAIEAVIRWTEEHTPAPCFQVDSWDHACDEMHVDLDRACDLDESGVRYVLPDGRVIETTLIDGDTLDKLVTGYVDCALWTDCLPPDPPHVVVGDDGHGYGIEQCGVLMPDERHKTRDGAQEVADLFNSESDDWNDESGGKEHLDPDDDLLNVCKLDCALFMTFAKAGDLENYVRACEDGTRESFDWSQGSPLEYAGHDLWLSSRGHGTGFWDRGLGELGKRLDEAATRMHRLVPEIYPYDVDGVRAGLN